MRKGRHCILIVDDEPRYVRSIRINLESSGYEVITAANGEQAVELAAIELPDLILLDILMPKMDGFETCRQIREFSATPIIMLTAMGDEASKVKGLDVGADDYITKPFGANELLARVRAVLRRTSTGETVPATLNRQIGELNIDFVRRRIFFKGNEIHLTSTEYRLLCEFAREVGRVLTPTQILEQVWGYGYDGEERLVWQVIHRLRQKIEPDPHHPIYIKNKPGIGYFLDEPN